jgi:hypothetical protein
MLQAKQQMAQASTAKWIPVVVGAAGVVFMAVGGVTLSASRGGGIALLVIGTIAVILAIAVFVNQATKDNNPDSLVNKMKRKMMASPPTAQPPPPPKPALARVGRPPTPPSPPVTWGPVRVKEFQTVDPPVVVSTVQEKPLVKVLPVEPRQTYQSAFLPPTADPVPPPGLLSTGTPYTPPNPYPTLNDLKEARERQVSRPQTPEWDRARRWNGLVEAAQQLKPEPRTVLLNPPAAPVPTDEE